MDSIFDRKITLKVGGEKHEADLSLFRISSDISIDMTEIAALMAFWGELASKAESEKIMVDAYYRQWRARTTEGLLKKSKEPEWKINSALEAMPEFEKCKKAIAQAAYNFQTLVYICRSLQQKAHLLQSKGAMMRTELLSTGMTTPSSVEKGISSEKKKQKNRETEEEVLKIMQGRKKLRDWE